MTRDKLIEINTDIFSGRNLQWVTCVPYLYRVHPAVTFILESRDSFQSTSRVWVTPLGLIVLRSKASGAKLKRYFLHLFWSGRKSVAVKFTRECVLRHAPARDSTRCLFTRRVPLFWLVKRNYLQRFHQNGGCLLSI